MGRVTMMEEELGRMAPAGLEQGMHACASLGEIALDRVTMMREELGRVAPATPTS